MPISYTITSRQPSVSLPLIWTNLRLIKINYHFYKLMTRFEVEQSIQSEISVFLSSSEELLFHTVIGAFEDVVKATK